ncbi:hypothetical protein ACFPRL_30635 [Pseudoclavibacter helvolus]
MIVSFWFQLVKSAMSAIRTATQSATLPYCDRSTFSRATAPTGVAANARSTFLAIRS